MIDFADDHPFTHLSAHTLGVLFDIGILHRGSSLSLRNRFQVYTNIQL